VVSFPCVGGFSREKAEPFEFLHQTGAGGRTKRKNVGGGRSGKGLRPFGKRIFESGSVRITTFVLRGGNDWELEGLENRAVMRGREGVHQGFKAETRTSRGLHVTGTVIS